MLSGVDTLAVTPTASRKSAIYQIPALVKAGPTIVVSPLIVLEWGSGMVERYEGDKIVVLFDEAGDKTLSLAAVIKRGLLERAA